METLSGPEALLGFKLDMSFTMPLVVTVMLGMGGTGLGGMSGRFEISSVVKLEKKDLFRMFAFSTSSTMVDPSLTRGGGGHTDLILLLQFDMTPEFLLVTVPTIQECGGGVLFLHFAYIKFDLFSKGLEFLRGLGGVRSFHLMVKALFLVYVATELAAEPGAGVLMFDRTLWEVFCNCVEDRGLKKTPVFLYRAFVRIC